MLKDFLKIEKWHGKNAWQPLALCEILGQPPTYPMLKDFKEFAFKGNLIDMAVGIIIGGAFGTVVKSLVDNVFMPVLGKLTGGINFTEQYVNLNFPSGPKIPYAQALKAGEPVIGFGQFCTDLISFVLLAFAVFIVIKKALGVLNKEKIAPAAPPAPSAEQLLLTEIRDLLRAKV
jgi:large conductance mechanosensitive channel